MMKRIFSFVIALIVMFSIAVPGNAQEVDAKKTGTYESFSYIENEDGTITIEMLDTSTSGVVTVPDTINRKVVAKISTYAFWDCVNVTEINIGCNVIQIGQMAFMNCPSLESINVAEENVMYQSIDGVLFNESLTSLIKCPSAKAGDFVVPDTVSSLATYAFFDCTKLTSLKLGASLKSIPSFAFSNCAALTEIEIPANVTDIGESAFSYCTKLEEIAIPDGVFYIGASAFAYCEAVKKVSIGTALLQMGNLVFSGCSSLTEFEVASGNLRYAAVDGMLCSKDGKTLYAYPSGRGASQELSDGITEIASYAFYSCGALESLIVPASVSEIGDYAFVSCLGLKEILFLGSAPELGSNVFYDTLPELNVYCLEENEKSFSATEWRDMNVSTIIKGDLNSDGSINSRDIARIQKHITGSDIIEGMITFITADMTSDGKINSRDVATLQKMIVA
ncbi:MAG: leucine-rich repeat protein [Clostridia bacterium]|nr:leucine-rich repeat protein [Clostridia bacterium]